MRLLTKTYSRQPNVKPYWCNPAFSCPPNLSLSVTIPALVESQREAPSRHDLTHPSPNFHGDQKVRNLASFSTSLEFEPLTLENAARYPNAETDFLCRNNRFMSAPSLVKLDPRTTENRSVKVPNPLKLHGENVLNRQ